LESELRAAHLEYMDKRERRQEGGACMLAQMSQRISSLLKGGERQRRACEGSGVHINKREQRSR
jgi:hypothetical protein